jgi:hypothetical protein
MDVYHADIGDAPLGNYKSIMINDAPLFGELEISIWHTGQLVNILFEL